MTDVFGAGVRPRVFDWRTELSPLEGPQTSAADPRDASLMLRVSNAKVGGSLAAIGPEHRDSDVRFL